MTDKAQDKRASPRRAVIRGAVTAFDGPQSPIECVMLDVSEGGARLHVHRIDELPSHFELSVEAEGIRRRCRVVWRRHDEVGVQFEAD